MDVTGVMSHGATTPPPPGSPTPAHDAARRDPARRDPVDGFTDAIAGDLASTADSVLRGASYVARTFGVPAGLRGLAIELAWTGVHLSLYPWGLLDEALRPRGTFAHHRTDALPPGQRSLIVSDMDASTTPVLLVHGIVDNRSIFALLARALRRRGFGVVHAVNFSPATAVTGDIRTAAAEIGHHVERLRASTGAERVHIVGHSLGGLMARYYVQRLGGDSAVDTLVTLGTPHRGTVAAHLLPPTRVGRQLRPGSDLIRELAEPAPDCRTRFLAVWSRQDQLIVPQRNARLTHPDLEVEHLELAHTGHMTLTADPATMHTVARLLARRRAAGGNGAGRAA